jgi:hypothetical protein
MNSALGNAGQAQLFEAKALGRNRIVEALPPIVPG